MVERKNGTDYYHYTYTDHLGSIVATCTQNGNPETEQNFDAWGRKRNPSTWSYSNVPNAPVWLYRGYTGHEGLKNFRLINMNGRMYDPVVGRMLSVDNETHGGTQGLNRYSYALNNPLKYTDPDGENPLLLAAAIYVTFFTDFGYELQKHVSPLAVHFNLGFGSNGFYAGMDASIGIPKFSVLSARIHGGVTYYSSGAYDGAVDGWQYNYGYELGVRVGPVGLSLSNTRYVSHASDSTSTSQSLSQVMIGGPFVNFKYQNDFMFGLGGDGGDRYRTAAAQFNVGLFQVGFNLVTGDPGGTSVDDRLFGKQTNNGKGVHDTYTGNGTNPEKYRYGVAYIGIGPIRFGRNSEN